MVNNFEIIKPLLKWDSSDDFYFIQILQRKKDHKEGGKVNGTNNNARLVKAYYVNSMEQLEFYMPEIIELCKVFNARAGINLNRRKYSKIHLKFMKKVLDQLENGTIDKAYKAYPSVVGANSHEPNKKWIVDIDEDEMVLTGQIKDLIELLQPISEREISKIIAEIPSKTGLHLITSPFNLKDFKEKFPQIDVQKNNPTSIFIP